MLIVVAILLSVTGIIFTGAAFDVPHISLAFAFAFFGGAITSGIMIVLGTDASKRQWRNINTEGKVVIVFGHVANLLGFVSLAAYLAWSHNLLNVPGAL